MAKNLILYYSRAGENYWKGGFKNLEKGNTELAAEYIQKAVGGDLFRIETERDYLSNSFRKRVAKRCGDRGVFHITVPNPLPSSSASARAVGLLSAFA